MRDLTRELSLACNDVSIETARTVCDINDAKRLRYQVYCVERGFLASTMKYETDTYDDHAHHVILRRRMTGEVIGAVRIVMYQKDKLDSSFPMQEVCPNVITRWLHEGLAEISRFAISKEMTGNAGLLRLCLVRGALDLTAEIGVSDLCMLIDPALRRLMGRSAIYYDQIGPVVDHHGDRVPCLLNIDTMLRDVQDEQPWLWRFLTAS